MASKIFVYRPSDANGDMAGIAYAEDGDELACHISSAYGFFRGDMGLLGDSGMGSHKHKLYREKYPDGFELIEVIGREALEIHIAAGDIKGLSFDAT